MGRHAWFFTPAMDGPAGSESSPCSVGRRSRTCPCRCPCASQCQTWAGGATSWSMWSCYTRCAQQPLVSCPDLQRILVVMDNPDVLFSCAMHQVSVAIPGHLLGLVFPSPYWLTWPQLLPETGGGAAGQQPGAAAQGGGVRCEHLLVRVPPLCALPQPHRRDLRARRARQGHPRPGREGVIAGTVWAAS